VGHSLSNSTDLPSDKDALQLMVLALLEERDQQKQHVEEQKQRAEAHSKQAAALQVELLRVKLELERYQKWYYGPCADRLQSDQDLAQMLLNFAEELDRKPVHAEDLPAAAKPGASRVICRSVSKLFVAVGRFMHLAGDDPRIKSLLSR